MKEQEAGSREQGGGTSEGVRVGTLACPGGASVMAVMRNCVTALSQLRSCA